MLWSAAMENRIRTLEEVQACTIGPVGLLPDGKVILVPHDPAWPALYELDRDLYQRTKLELAGRRWEFTQQYADSKSVVVNEIVARAGRQPSESPAS
jgi:GrpB-like predicted nucleotidyltransferase (UPF0157 family)